MEIKMIGYGSVWLVFFLLLVLARRRGMGMAEYLYTIGRKRGWSGSKGVREDIRILQPDCGGKSEKEEEYVREFYIGKIRLLLQMLFAGSLFAALLLFAGRMDGMLEEGEEGNFIKRNGYGLGSRETKLRVETMEEDGVSKSRDITFTVEEMQYEDALVETMADKLAGELPERILGANLSLEEVREDLELIREAEGYPFRIRWESDDYSCINSDGSVENGGLGEEGSVICLTAALAYGEYKEEVTFPVHILPPIASKEETFGKKIYELLEKEEKNSRNNGRVRLPDYAEGKTLVWSEEREDGSGILFLLVCIGTAAVYFLRDRDLKDRVEARNKQMLMDYPQLVSRMALYMGAGMTVRNVFRKIALDYRKERREGGRMHYVYEEMLFTCYELDSGISETVAYERFGKRCRMIRYMKFANLLVQNLKKGSNSILEALRREAVYAFEDRKNMARKLGEEASTKLLLPMMLMLGIVMVLIIIPAYFSFSL